MKYSRKIITILLCQVIWLLTFQAFAQNNCENPLSLDWLQFSLGDPCVEGIYAFEYDGNDYVYLVSKPECIAADARNTLYNCNDESFCYVFGFTLPEDQCDIDLQQAIDSLSTSENLIYPLQNNGRACENPLELRWVSESLTHPCTDGIYVFEHENLSYIYRSTACEYVDDPNTLYNCNYAESCFVEGRTFPEAQCDLRGFPLDDYLTNQNLIWSSPLLRLLPEYQWLASKVNFRQCEDVEIKEYKTTNANYVSIKKGNTVELFAQNGSLLCSTSANLSCISAYGLTTPDEEWACNARTDEPCGIDEPQNTLPWLQTLIDETGCDCNTSIIQYCYNGEVYFDSTPIDPGYCADYAGFIRDIEGNVICQNGGITGGDCSQVFRSFYQTAENIGLVWSCNDNCGCNDSGNPVCGADGNVYDSACSATCAGVSEVPCEDNTGCETLQFASLNSGCECCNDIILFEITGGDGNYEVTTIDGQAITNGMRTAIFSIGANEIMVTDGQGCSTIGIFNNFPICCEVPPICEAIRISYNCVTGLQINGEGDCNSVALKDQNENTYNHGDFLYDGIYNFTEANPGQVSPPCIASNVNVSCQDDSTCNLPPDSGPCEAYIPRYYYNTEAEECMQFIYGGCEGNDNNYESYEVCTNSCGYNYSCIAVEDPFQLAWLQKIMENANGCSVRELIQFTYNDNIYFKTIPSGGGNFCPTDMPVHYYNCNGLRLCSQGFTPFPTCNQEMVNASIDSGTLIWTYGEEDCNNLQFDFVQYDCGPCCDQTLEFSISGGDGNYTVSTIDGIEVYNGMPLNSAGLGDSFTLLVTDGKNCSAEQDFTNDFFCCEVPPKCSFYEITYDCNEGLQVIGEGECDDASFTDEVGNTYEPGSILANGNYTLTSGGHPLSPSCADFELAVSCTGETSNCDFEDVVITSDPGLCGFGIVNLTTNEVFGNAGTDDYEITFVKVQDDNTFEVLVESIASGPSLCYYAIAYRWSCGAPDFYTNNFQDILDNAGDYKVSECFAIDYIQAPEFSVTTEPYCDGEGLFTLGVTITGGSGSYVVGQDYTGETIYGETGENFITFANGRQFYDIYPSDRVTGCANDYIIPIEDPGCGSFNICELPMVIGPCEALIPRYYYNAEQGDCVEFSYGGCEGNENNFETYTACLDACGNTCNCDDVYDPVCGIDGVTYDNVCQAECEGIEIDYEGECTITELNCLQSDPLQWLWMQNLITEHSGCNVFEIREFTYQGTQHFKTVPGYPQNLACATDAPSTYYNCEGDFVCETGFLNPDSPTFCNGDILLADDNERVIWTYNETNCADPFELELVQNAIADETCTGGIYAFDFAGESFVYIQTLCEFIDAPNVLYNCNKGTSCSIGGETIFVEACYQQFDEISNLINDENLIWTKSCEYEFSGTVKDRSDTEGCGLLIELADSTILEPEAIPDGFTLRDGQKVEFSFRRIPIFSQCPFAEKAEIICIREVDEGCVCDTEYTPVCGVDGNTYSNACEAECEGVEVAYEGECEDFCICPAVYDPVCGVDGNTYGNECEAACEGVEIAYTGECINNNNPEILNTYSWLNNMVYFEGGCENGLTATEFAWSETYSFIYVQWPEGEGQLYYQDGTYYCTDGQGYACLDVYNLTNAVSSWTCNQPNNEGPNEIIEVTFDEIKCNDDGTFTIDLSATGALSESYGLYHSYSIGAPNFVYFKEGESASFGGNVTDAENGLFTAFIFDQYLADAAAKKITIDVSDCRIMPMGGNDLTLFNQYNWLSDLVDPEDCAPGYEITEYDFGSYSFVHVKANNSGNLYLGDGTYYCSDAPGFSCVEAYGFTNSGRTTGCSNVVDCPDVLQPVCGMDGNTYDNTCQAERAGVNVAYEGACTNSQLFSKYEWLSDIITEGDCNAGNTVNEYDFGSYSFIYVQANNTGSLYLNDGTFYCNGGGVMQKEQSNDTSGYLKFEQDFKVYPNPNNGKFKVAFINDEQSFTSINILSIDGKLKQSIQIENYQPLVEVDLTGMVKGIYLVQLQASDYIKTQKVIIH